MSVKDGSVLPTPTAIEKQSKKKREQAISLARENLPLHTRITKDGSNRQYTIADAIIYNQMLPTPTASDYTKQPSNGLYRLMTTGQRYSKGHHKNKMLPTPTPSLPSLNPCTPAPWKRKLQHKSGCQLGVTIAIDNNIQQEQAIGQRLTLNPLFVEWMMGFPENWTVPD